MKCLLSPFLITLLISGPSPLATKIQNNALHFFFGLGKAAPTASLLGDSGWVPIHLNLQFMLLIYWFSLGNLDADRLPKLTLQWSIDLAKQGKMSWAFKVNSLDRKLINVESKHAFQYSLWVALAKKYWPPGKLR